eukprot:tig00000190_g13863.t1
MTAEEEEGPPETIEREPQREPLLSEPQAEREPLEHGTLPSGGPMSFLWSATKAGYIPPEGLRNLHNYKYKGVDLSLLTKYVLNPFWEWTLRFVPMWIAPNMITLLGLCCTLVTYLIMLYYCPDLQGRAPAWAYVLCSIGLFAYQTMDNLDGKQARRTRTSSPLGQLFDHGCDALSCMITTLTLASAIQLGPTWATVILGFHLFVTFYLASWEEYHTGVLFLGIVSGPIEGIICICIVYMMTAFVGPAFWTNTFADWGYYGVFAGMQMNEVFAVGFCTTAALTGVWNIRTVILEVRRSGGRLGPSFRLLLPTVLLTVLTCWWLYVSPSAILRHRARSAICLVGFIASNQVARIIIARLCNCPFQPGYLLLAPMGLAVVNAYTGVFKHGPAFIDEDWLLNLYLGGAFLAWLHLSISIINDFTTFLHIRCLWIPYPPPSETQMPNTRQ